MAWETRAKTGEQFVLSPWEISLFLTHWSAAKVEIYVKQDLLHLEHRAFARDRSSLPALSVDHLTPLALEEEDGMADGK